MSVFTLYLPQTATHWAVNGITGTGQPQFDAPVQLKCRWEQRNDYVINDDGHEVLSRARIFLGVDVVVGDYLYLGVSTQADPRGLVGAFKVLQFRKTPGLRAEIFERKAYL